MDATGETGEGHLGISTANEEAGHTAFRVEHVGHDMGERTTTTSTNEETSREGTDSTESGRDEQTENVIETDILGEKLPAHCTRSGEEAGSIVLHVSSDMNEKEKGDEEADETAAAKKNEEISKEDVEIRRLIEERRNTPKEEKQRLKEVNQCIKIMHQGQKLMKRQQDIQRILEDFKGVKNIPGIKSAKRRVLITKIKNEKGEVITSRRGIANVFGEFCKKLYDDNDQEETEQEIGENGK